MNIGILASGGDGAGMNYCLHTLYKKLYKKNNITLFNLGYYGLIYDKTCNFDKKYLGKVKNDGGICIKTSRCPELETNEGIDNAIKTLQKYDIDCLVVLGGNGSLLGLKEIHDRGMDVMFIPCTIDNDLAGSDYTLGHNTACENCIKYIQKVNDTMQSFNRVCIYEVMGRRCPQIAITVGKNVKADYVYSDEFCTKETCAKEIKNSTNDAKIVILRENLIDINELKQYIEQKNQIEVRTCVIGYYQRGGSPTKIEKKYAKNFAKKCAKCINQNKLNSAIITKNNSYYSIDINKI